MTHKPRHQQFAGKPRYGNPGQLVINRHGGDFRMRNTDPLAWNRWRDSNGPVIIRNAGLVEVGNIPDDIPGITFENIKFQLKFNGASVDLTGKYTFSQIFMMNLKWLKFGSNDERGAELVFQGVEQATLENTRIKCKICDFSGVNNLYLKSGCYLGDSCDTKFNPNGYISINYINSALEQKLEKSEISPKSFRYDGYTYVYNPKNRERGS